MAIIKSIGNVSKNINGAKAVLNYVGKKAELTQGLNCSNDYRQASMEFKETKDFYRKNVGRQYKHIIQSFKEGEVDKEKALKIGVEFCRKSFPEYEVFIATHTDKKHIHNHIILNSVSLESGRKYHESRLDLIKLKQINNEICKENGLEIPEKSKEKGKVILWEQKKYRAIQKGINNEKQSDSLRLARTIVDIAKQSENKMDFIRKMLKEGYETNWEENKKNIVFKVKKDILMGKKDKFRLKTLKKDFNYDIFSKEGLENEFLRTRSEDRKNRESDINRERSRDIGFDITD